jgi:hypothetical protein
LLGESADAALAGLRVGASRPGVRGKETKDVDGVMIL